MSPQHGTISDAIAQKLELKRAAFTDLEARYKDWREKVIEQQLRSSKSFPAGLGVDPQFASNAAEPHFPLNAHDNEQHSSNIRKEEGGDGEPGTGLPRSLTQPSEQPEDLVKLP